MHSMSVSAPGVGNCGEEGRGGSGLNLSHCSCSSSQATFPSTKILCATRDRDFD